MIRFAVNGAGGRMGKRIVALLADQQDCRLVCALERAGHPDMGKDAGQVAGTQPAGVPLTGALAGAVEKPDVLLDFSTPESTLARADECAAAGVAIVIGTTGLGARDLEHLRSKAAAVPVLVAPNMSVGVNLLTSLVGRVAAALGTDYDIEIVEMHHRRKKDAPSGTALKLAEEICTAMGWRPCETLIFGRQGMVGERPRGRIAVHAVRGGDVVGDHTVIYAGDGERIEITHRATSRDVFALGAIRAGRFLAGRRAGLYTMAQVLNQGGAPGRRPA